ncbi:carbamoyltransferase HypF [candidate division KSB1 bacterium]|nr:carbamoyltransferase HypF [candidate division KSB1 bacterium]
MTLDRADTVKAVRITVNGAVQGVGFRPFLYRLATRWNLGGWVRNTPHGVEVHLEGPETNLLLFLHALQHEKPAQAVIYTLETAWMNPVGSLSFDILSSSGDDTATAWVLPDLAVCSDCLQELLDPENRRYLYPFINCTHCGPRFSILKRLPYDRPNTSMDEFQLCPDCAQEYADPTNRRFHAQPNACPVCGPQLAYCNSRGNVESCGQAALEQTVRALQSGEIVAVKGLSGFHLMTDARNQESVLRLRNRKQRESKPLAIMLADLDSVHQYCSLDSLESEWLDSPQSPLLILRKKRTAPGVATLAQAVAPNNPFLGVLLPYTPLHHLLMRFCKFPLIATSGNLAEETVCIGNQEAIDRLGNIADAFVLHNRRIVRHADDSIGRIVGGRRLVLRRARGYAPLPITIRTPLPSAFAAGGQQKNTLAYSKSDRIFISQHIGDLDSVPAYRTFLQTANDLGELLQITPQKVVCDAHPTYRASIYARRLTPSPIAIQHHVAHIFSCMAENDIEPPVLGVAWDGSGYGSDKTIWGGEFFTIRKDGWKRFAHFRRFPLLGGERAIREPRRCALAIDLSICGKEALQRQKWLQTGWTPTEINNLYRLYSDTQNSILTSSVGRLFDAVASTLDLCHFNEYEAQAAQAVEFAALECPDRTAHLPYRLSDSDPIEIDWTPLFKALLEKNGINDVVSSLCRKFHNTLAQIVVSVALRAGINRIVLSGGCFQNALLQESVSSDLSRCGFEPIVHQRVPPNDGGISLGQLAALAYLPSLQTFETNSTAALTNQGAANVFGHTR